MSRTIRYRWMTAAAALLPLGWTLLETAVRLK
jgi:hypothetical protein